MQKINLRELYPDVYKSDVFVDVAEEVVAAMPSTGHSPRRKSWSRSCCGRKCMPR